jgi:hemolysin activation/secretion protein
MTFGGHRLDIKGDQLSINETNGIIGFNDTKLFGDKKMIFSLQTQSYSPWQFAGFRFNPFLNYTLAFLGDSENGFKKSEGFSRIGLGVLISNDYLVFTTFQLSLAFYPKIPNEGINIIRTNNFRTSDFGYLDFEINKPRTVIFN